MKANEVSPNLIGKQVRVAADTVRIEGTLCDLGVLTETVHDDPLVFNYEPDPTIGETYLAGVILNISGHELRLHGNEQVTILDSEQ